MIGKKFLALALGSAIVSSASAAEPNSFMRAYFDVGPQYVFADNDRQSKDGIGAFGHIGTPITPWVGLEGGAFYDHFGGKKSGPDWNEYGFEIGGLVTYPKFGSFIPYLVGSIGGVESKTNGAAGESSFDPQGAIGLGFFKYFEGNDLGIRLDARYRGINLDNDKFEKDLGEVVVRLGLVIPFGEPLFVAEPEAPVAAPAGPLDSDGDGVPDADDRCPKTPKGEKVGPDGCPLVAQTDDKELTADVYFAFNSEKLDAESIATLNIVASKLNSRQALRVVLKGHTDDVGSNGYNQALSERRAVSVRKYLTSRGVLAERLSIEAYGESRPAASNDTEAGRAKNRRVEVRPASGE